MRHRRPMTEEEVERIEHQVIDISIDPNVQEALDIIPRLFDTIHDRDQEIDGLKGELAAYVGDLKQSEKELRLAQQFMAKEELAKFEDVRFED